MDVTLPDGTVIRNVPEGTTKEQLYAKLKAAGYDMSKLTASGPALVEQQQGQALRERVARQAASDDPLAPIGGGTGAGSGRYQPSEQLPEGNSRIGPDGRRVADQPKSLQQDIADRLGAGADFLMAPLRARNTGGDDPTGALVAAVIEPTVRLPEALVRDPLKTVAQDYNPIYQMGMGLKDVEGAAASALQGDFGAAGTQALEGVTEMLGGGLGLVGVRGGPKAPGSTTATSLGQAERMAANTRVAPGAPPAAAPTPPPAAAMTYEEVADLVRTAARGGMGSQQAVEKLARAAPLNKDAAAAAQRLAIDVPPDVLLDHTQLKEAIGLTRSMPSTVASAAWADAVQRAATQADEAMALIDGSTDLAEISDSVLQTMTRTQGDLQKQADEIYGRINARIRGTEEPDGAVRFGAGANAPGGTAPAAGNVPAFEQKFAKEAQRLIDYNGGVDKAIDAQQYVIDQLVKNNASDDRINRAVSLRFAIQRMGERANRELDNLPPMPADAPTAKPAPRPAKPIDPNSNYNIDPLGDAFIIRNDAGEEVLGAPEFPDRKQALAWLQSETRKARQGGGAAPDVGALKQQGFNTDKVYYHGGDVEFDTFDMTKAGRREVPWYGRGAYLTPDRDMAKNYAAGGKVMPFYVRGNMLQIRKPEDWPSWLNKEADIPQQLKDRGYVGIDIDIKTQGPVYDKNFRPMVDAQGKLVTKEESMPEVVVFDPANIVRADKAPTPKADTWKRDPATLNLGTQDYLAYINAKHPPATPDMTPPYFVAASTLKRTNGDRQAAQKELADRVAYLRKTKAKPEVIENADRAAKAVADVDPMFFNDAAFNSRMSSEITARGEAALEPTGLTMPPPKPRTETRFNVDLVNSRRLLDGVVRDLGNDVSKLTPLEKELREMSSPGRKLPVTYTALMRMKADVGQALQRSAGPYKDVDSAILKRLYGALSEDQLAHAQKVGGDTLRSDLRLANQLVAKRKALEDRIVSLFGDERDGSIARKLVLTVQGGAKGDVTGFNRIVRQLPADLRKKAVATAIAAAAREAKTGGFGFAKYVDLYQGLRRNSEVYKTVVETLGPDSDKFLRDLYSISKRITEARANVKTTGQANQALVQGMMAEGLVQQVMNSSAGRQATMGTATVLGGTMAGPVAGATSAMLVNALSKGKKNTINAAGDLFASPEWQQLVAKVAAENRVDKKAFNAASLSKQFRAWAKSAEIADPDAWLRNALAASIGAGIAANASEMETAQ